MQRETELMKINYEIAKGSVVIATTARPSRCQTGTHYTPPTSSSLANSRIKHAWTPSSHRTNSSCDRLLGCEA